MKMSVVDLVFDAPRLLEWLGWSVTKRPHLFWYASQPSFPAGSCPGLSVFSYCCPYYVWTLCVCP